MQTQGGRCLPRSTGSHSCAGPAGSVSSVGRTRCFLCGNLFILLRETSALLLRTSNCLDRAARIIRIICSGQLIIDVRDIQVPSQLG